MSALRVLHVCPRPSFSGLEAYALAMAQGQRDLGVKVTMVVLRGSPLADRARTAGIQLFEIDNSFAGRAGFAWWALRKLTGAAEIVHLHSTQDLDLLWPAFFAARKKPNRPRVVLQTHIWISHSKRDPLHAFTYSLIDELWCSSEPARKTLEQFIPISPKKIRIVNYGREIRDMRAGFLTRAEARSKLNLPQDAIVVGTVARIDEGKGTRELLEASLQAMAVEPKLHLMLIGPPTADDPNAILYAEKIRERIASLSPGLKSRVHAPGAVAESFKLLRAFDLFALPTYKECFALSLLEALLAGVPCLAANSGGSPEVVREGETGWLFEPRSVESLHSTLQRALGERPKWQEFGRKGADRVGRDFDFQRILPTTVEAYRSLL